ncbi:MAG: hypothetical protein ACOZAJ_04165, partial [Patescibacteria group bacterium]
EKKGRLISHTRRLSAMFFGEINENNFDIRVRITNGQSEVVVKKGALHAVDRLEVSQSITREQFLGFVRLFVLFGFKSEIAERETYNFLLNDSVIFSVVKAGNISYVEIEKMSSKDTLEVNRKHLLDLISEYDLKLMNSREEFNNLCGRLSKQCDWLFTNTVEDFNKLKEIFIRY